MTQYSNPDLTQREIVEGSLEQIEAIIAQVDVSASEAEAHKNLPLDFQTAQVVSQHVSMLNGTKYQLNSELTRLKNIIAVWNGEEPVQTTTPYIPTQPLN